MYFFLHIMLPVTSIYCVKYTINISMLLLSYIFSNCFYTPTLFRYNQNICPALKKVLAHDIFLRIHFQSAF